MPKGGGGHGQPASILSRKRSPGCSRGHRREVGVHAACERGPKCETGAPVREICKREEAAAAAAAAAGLHCCHRFARCAPSGPLRRMDGRTRPHEHLENLANAETFSLSPSLSRMSMYGLQQQLRLPPQGAHTCRVTRTERRRELPLHNVKLCDGARASCRSPGIAAGFAAILKEEERGQPALSEGMGCALLQLQGNLAAKRG